MRVGQKVQFVKRHLGIMSSFQPQEERQLARDFVLHYLKDDGVFVTRLLSLNSSDLVVTEIINHLWLRYKTNHRLYSTNQNPRSGLTHSLLANDVNLNTSLPGSNANYQNGTMPGNDHYRQRATRIPPPPLPLFAHRTIDQQYKSEKSELLHDPSKSAKDTDV